jgi:hypothetical protein
MDSILKIIKTFNINLTNELKNIEEKIILSNQNIFYNKLKEYIKINNINYNLKEYINLLEKNNEKLFDYFCYKNINFIKKINLPKITIKNKKEVIFINFDKNNQSFEFILRNNILILGSNWNITIICKPYNYFQIKEIILNISKDINLIKINNNQNIFFINLNFWEKIKGENIIIIDKNILLTKNNFKSYINNDFLIFEDYDNFSIRKKSILINVIKFVKNIKNTFNDEKKFFSKRLEKFKLGNFNSFKDNIPGNPINFNSNDLLNDLNNNINFLIDYEDNFLSILELFDFNIQEKQYKSLLLSKQKYNYIEIDINFVNDLISDSIINKIEYFHKIGIQNSILCNKKQITNFYPNAKIVKNINNKIFIKYNSKCYSLKKFWNIYFINKELKFFEKIDIIKNNISDSDLLILINIDNNIIGLELLEKFAQKFKKYCFAINLTCNNKQLIINYIQKNIKKYIITKTLKFGSDIEPSIILYKYIEKKIKFKYILKLHTKNNKIWRNELISPFLLKSNNHLLKIIKKKNIGMIGKKKYLINDQNFCKNILNKIFSKKQLKNSEYIGGSIFMCKKIVFDTSIYLFSKYMKQMYIMIFYYDNILFKDTSLRHSMERIFGICNKYLNLNIIGIE